MKITNLVLKVVAAMLAMAALSCCILANLDKINACFLRLRDRVAEKRASCCCGGDCEEFDDFEEWPD